MSSSVDRRLSRLLGRVAEERVARGRPAQSHTPSFSKKRLPSTTSQPPEMTGTEAVLAAFEIVPFINVRGRQITRMEVIYDSEGNYQKPVYFQDTSTVGITAGGIDYAEIATSGAAPNIRAPVRGSATKPSANEISLIDRLFP